MDLQRMLANCERDQWDVRDLDWSQTPRTMSPDDEAAIVQLFTDMAGIELLAGALFAEQAKRAQDPTLRAIFQSFVKDEARHSECARRLAAFYDVRKLRAYRQNASLARFFPHFLDAIRLLGDDVANIYVTGGELILDVALLRSINDYVDDAMSAQAMRLINRDESRHIAIDYFMVDYYASPDYVARLDVRAPPSPRERARAWWSFACVLYFAKPFFRDVFFRPMERVDPTADRLREAFKRFQLLGARPGNTTRPFGKFLRALQDVYNHPQAGPLLGTVVARLAGVEPRFMERLNSEDEIARAAGMTMDALAEEALAAKLH